MSGTGPDIVNGTRGRSGPYLPGLDGMRAFAVMAVLFWHSALSGAPAGLFLGVEVFFVLSGFIITANIVREWRKLGRIELKQFWYRRGRRLLPALFLLLIVVLVWTELFLREEVAGLRSDTLATLAYVMNWFLIFSGENYFDTFGRPSLLRHLWTLAIEEQFYLLWPLIAFVGLKLLRRRVFAGFVLVGAIASAVWMAILFEPGQDVSRVYYGTDTRMSGLLLGAALALVWSPPVSALLGRGHRIGLELVAVSAFGALAYACLAWDQTTPMLYRGGFAGVGLMTAILIVPAVTPGTWTAAVLGCSPLRWIGLRSYGIYLWHWPIFMLSRPGQDVSLDGPLLVALQIVATFVIAAASYKWLEVPVRSGALGRFAKEARGWRSLPRWRVGSAAATSMAGLATLVVIGGVAVAARPVEEPDYFKLESVRIINDPTAQRDTSAASRLPDESLDTPSGLAIAVGIVRSSEMSGDRANLVLSPTPLDEKTVSLPSGVMQQGSGEMFDVALDELFDAILEPPPEPVMVTAVGDSVMLGAAARLAADAPDIQLDIDAVVSRAMTNAIQVLTDSNASGQMGNLLLLHIGNNGPINDEQVERVLEIAGPDRKVVFLNLRVTRYWEEANNEVLARVVGQHENAVLIDWYEASADKPGIFWSDGTHLRPEGAAFYSELVRPHLVLR